MSSLRRRAFWLATGLVLLGFATLGTALAAHDAADAGPGRSSAHHAVVDHDAAMNVRPVAERPTLDLRTDHTLSFLLAWIGVLLVAALVARTTVHAADATARRARQAAPTRRVFDRGPPALACV